MLKALNIRNFALVKELDIEFDAGLTVITGESGAGKTILLDALGLVLGNRAKRSQLRPDSDACEVCVEFDIADHPRSRQALATLDLTQLGDETTCLVRRIAGERRSRAFVNGTPATLATLQALAEPLIDIHGQFEHRQLLTHEAQRRLLDEFGVAATTLAATANSYQARMTLAQELDDSRVDAERTRERKSLLRYQIDELAALGDSIHRVDELTTTFKRLSRAQEIKTTIGGALQAVDEDLVARAARLASLLDGVDDPHANLRNAAELAGSAQTHLEECVVELRHYMDSFPEDDAELAVLEQVLAAIHDVARKHRVPAAELGTHLIALERELSGLADDEARLAELEERAAAAEAQFLNAARALSEARREAAAPFAEQVTKTLAELGLGHASLQIEFAPGESAAGLETVAFKAATNPRYPAAGLKEVASGGELSRIALAIQVVAAERARLPCLILDEADVGVGGTTADVLGRVLRRLSRNTQVIAITHAPQIAALGDTHLKVAKTSAQDTVVRALAGNDRTEELARMLGGQTITDDSRAYAKTLLDQAAN